jgi:hypothetical protein
MTGGTAPSFCGHESLCDPLAFDHAAKRAALNRVKRLLKVLLSKAEDLLDI